MPPSPLDMHLPALHTLPDGHEPQFCTPPHPSPCCPQLSPCCAQLRGTQLPPSVLPLAHMPALQMPLMHLIPQPPQLLGSLAVDVQTGPHIWFGGLHGAPARSGGGVMPPSTPELPQTPTFPPAPQVMPIGHEPQFIIPPHPSPKLPQL
jgi:hypothetical protein